VHGTCAGDGLEASNLMTHSVSGGNYPSSVGYYAHPLLFESWAVSAQDELLRGGCEVCQTGNGQVLVVEVGVVAEDLVGLR
jgi:hypothetical protein